MMFSNRKKAIHVVVLAHHGLGDLIMTLPTLITIDKYLPLGSCLSILVKSSVESQVLQLIKWLRPTEFINFGYNGAWSYHRVLHIGLLVRRLKPEVFIAPHAAPGLLPAFFAYLIAAPISVGPLGRWWQLGFSKSVSLRSDQHKVEYYSDFARQAGLFEKLDIHVNLLISQPKEDMAATLLTEKPDKQRWVMLAPGSSAGEMHKRWPQIHYQELMRCLLENTQLNIALLGSPGETNLLQALAEGMPSNRIRVLAQPDIEVSLALIKRAAVLVCGCTGAGHMAALVGTPIIGLFGPTNPIYTGPYTSKLTTMRCENCTYAPCYGLGFERGCGKPTCMHEISVNQVYAAVLKVLDA